VPASQLRLHTVDEQTIVVGNHPSADLDACAMRRLIRASARPGGPDHAHRIARIELGGSLDDLGGGVVRVVRAGIEQRWIASLLAPHHLVELLGEVELDQVPDEAMHASVKPDPQLGVSLLVITANDPRHAHHLDALAAQAAAALFVEELRCSVLAEHLRSTPHGERAGEANDRRAR
jgi:hypothetical protein